MAAGDGKRVIRNAPYRFIFGLRDASGQLVSSASTPDSEVSLDSAAYGDAISEATEIGSSGTYYLDLTAAEMTGDTVTAIVKSGNANTLFHSFEFEPALDSGVAQAATSTTLTLRSAASSTDDHYNGAAVEIVRGTGAGQVRTITDYTGSSTIATVDRVWVTNPDTTSIYLVHPRVSPNIGTSSTGGLAGVNVVQISGSATAADNCELLYDDGLLSGTIASGPTTTSLVTSGLSVTDDFYNTAMIHFTSGVCKSLTRQITDYDGDTFTVTFGALPTAPSIGDKFVIFGKVF